MLKLIPRQYMTQPRSYNIGSQYGTSDYNLAGAAATRVSLKEVIEDPGKLFEGWEKESLESSKEKRIELTLKQRIIETQGYKDITPENILLTHATYEANFLAVSQTVDDGDDIIISVPTWYQFAAYMDQRNEYSFCCGGLHPNSKVHILYADIDNGWKYPIERLKELVTHKTALIVIVSPNNPTGVVISESEMRAICEIAEENGSYVLHDQIYRGLEFDKSFSSPNAVNMYDKAIGTGSLSKTLGFEPVNRVGWLVTRDKKLMQRAKTLNDWYISRLGWLEMYVTVEALEPTKYASFIERARKTAIECWDVVAKFMDEHKDVFTWVKPQAAFLSFPKYHLNIKSWDFCEKLAAPPYKTRVLPGIDYGYEHHLRLGVGGQTPDKVMGGLERLKKFLDTIL
jgi:aspartate/methionine/tyrosine aminotransferase